MQLRVLGCSGTYPTATTPSSGYLFEDGETKVWVDCGTGTFPALQQTCRVTDVDALVVTHVHSDHCVDLYPFYYARRFDPAATERLPVYCPAGTEEHLARFLVGDGACKLGFIFDFRTIDEHSEVEVGSIRMTFMLTDHPIPTYAVRAVSATGGDLTYSSDTGPGADLHDFAEGTDLLLCEASYQEGALGPPLHLSAQQAGEYAKRGRVRDLMLTHFWPTHDREVSRREAAEAAGDIPVHLARPGGVYDVATRRWL